MLLPGRNARQEKMRATSLVAPSATHDELLVAEQKSSGDSHVVVIARSIGMQREPVKLDRTHRHSSSSFYVHSASEHHGKSVV